LALTFSFIWQENSFAGRATSPIRFLISLNQLDHENKAVLEENRKLKSELARLSELMIEQKVLEREKASSSGFEILATAKVIGRTPIGLSQQFILNQGKNSLIKDGQAVISQGYLVGRIKETYDDQSKVELISNYRSQIPAVLLESRNTGLVQGSLEGIFLTEIPATSQINANETVVTSGLGGDLPPGIIIGKVTQTVTARRGLFQSIKVETPINFSSIEYVSVLK